MNTNLPAVVSKSELEVIISQNAVIGEKAKKTVTSLANLLNLKPEEVPDLLEMQKVHKTTFHAIMKIAKKGYSMKEIDQIYDTRENLTAESRGLISLESIHRLLQQFPDTPIDADYIANQIEEAAKYLYREYFNQVIERIIDIAKTRKSLHIQDVIDFLESEENSRFRR